MRLITRPHGYDYILGAQVHVCIHQSRPVLGSRSKKFVDLFAVIRVHRSIIVFRLLRAAHDDRAITSRSAEFPVGKITVVYDVARNRFLFFLFLGKQQLNTLTFYSLL